MNFSETIAAALRGERVGITTLLKFDFEGDPFYAWTGAGILDKGGIAYRGLGELASIDALPLGIGDSAGEAKFSISGVDPEIVALARSEADKVEGRTVTVWKQLLASPYITLDAPIYMGAWVMMAPRFSFSGPSGRTISVSARSIFDDRNLHEEAYYSDRYLQAQYPGDKFFEYIGEITTGVKVRWPERSD